MFCQNCGKEIAPYSNMCSNCGNPISAQPQQSYYTSQQQPPKEEDGKSFLYGFIGFMVPIVGFVLYAVFKDDMPLRAKSCLKGALITTILAVALFLFCFIGIIALSTYNANLMESASQITAETQYQLMCIPNALITNFR